MLSNKEFQNYLANNISDEKLAYYLNIMNKSIIKQEYLTQDAFKRMLEYCRICKSLINKENLNETQNLVKESYLNTQKYIKEQQAKIITEEGPKRIYQPNGFTSALVIIGICLIIGIFTASFFMLNR